MTADALLQLSPEEPVKKKPGKPKGARNKPGEFICPECSLISPTAQGLGRHRRAAHNVPGAGKSTIYPVKKAKELANGEISSSAPVNRKHDEPIPANAQTQAYDLFVANAAGQLEGFLARIAFENDLPPRKFARRVSEYFHALAHR